MSGQQKCPLVTTNTARPLPTESDHQGVGGVGHEAAGRWVAHLGGSFPGEDPAEPHRIAGGLTDVGSARCVGVGIEDADSSHVSNVFLVGNPAALRLSTSMHRDRPATLSTKRALTISAGSQRCALAVAISSGANTRA